jgi:hypothetical protein
MSRFATRLAVTVAASTALLGVAALPAAATGHGRPTPRSSVALGAVQYNNPGPADRSSRSLNGEWVTVTNNERRTVDLAGWTLSDADHNTYRFGHLRLAGHQSVRVHTGTGHNTSRDVYQDRRAHVWDSTDTATLRDDHGRVADSVSWGRHSGGRGNDPRRGGGDR